MTDTTFEVGNARIVAMDEDGVSQEQLVLLFITPGAGERVEFKLAGDEALALGQALMVCGLQALAGELPL